MERIATHRPLTGLSVVMFQVPAVDDANGLSRDRVERMSRRSVGPLAEEARARAGKIRITRLVVEVGVVRGLDIIQWIGCESGGISIIVLGEVFEEIRKRRELALVTGGSLKRSRRTAGAGGTVRSPDARRSVGPVEVVEIFSGAE